MELTNNKRTVIVLSLCGLAAGIMGAIFPGALIFGGLGAVLFTVFLLFDYSRFIFILGLYVFIDYLFRYILPSPLLASFWDELLLIFAVCLWFYKWIFYRKKPGYHSTPLDIPIMFYIVIAFCLLLINSPVPAIGLAGFRQTVQQILWYFIAVQLLASVKNVRWFLYLMVFSGGLLGLHGVYQYITKAEMPAYWVENLEAQITTRVFSIIGSPNILGSLLVLIIPVSISLIFTENKLLKKYLFGTCTLLMCTTLVFTSSRSAWIGFIFSMAVFFWLKDKRLILLFLILVFAAYLFIPTINNRVDFLLSANYFKSSALGGRLARWTTAMAILRQNTVFGVGLGQFGGAVAQNFKIPNAFYVDSYFLRIAVEMGLAGLTAFCIFIYNVLAWGIRAVKSITQPRQLGMAQGIYAGLVGVIVPNFVENVFEVPMMLAYFSIFTALLIFLGYTDTGEDPEKSSGLNPAHQQ
ncbi:MAG: O-antigen polymerase [Eubacterium sp.]|nr:O-antigen polymerase [Eubacterium sp.]